VEDAVALPLALLEGALVEIAVLYVFDALAFGHVVFPLAFVTAKLTSSRF
jgi:hypothetical protein